MFIKKLNFLTERHPHSICSATNNIRYFHAGQPINCEQTNPKTIRVHMRIETVNDGAMLRN